MEYVQTQNIGTRPNGNSGKTHCRKGHPFSPENTYISPKSGKRSCITCRGVYVRERQKDPAVKEYFRIKMQGWRANNREREHRNYNDLRRRKKEWLYSQKLACSLCGETRQPCLQFHHRDPSQKDANLSEALASWSIERLQEELAKCSVLCANCHLCLHAAEREAAGRIPLAAGLPIRKNVDHRYQEESVG